MVLLALGAAVPAVAEATETLFTDQTPALTGQNDHVSYELGMKFRSAKAGTINAIRYWKDKAEPAGSHVGHIWDSTGNLLATVTFQHETESGWQQQALAMPLTISADTTYVVSVNIVSYYVATIGGLATQIVNKDLASVADGANGVFGNPGLFPTQTFNNTNYFRDIVFSPSSPAPPLCAAHPGNDLVLQKLVSVDGGTTFRPYPNSASPALAQLGTPVQFQLAVTNCSTYPLKPVNVDDCVNFNPNATPFACAPVSAGGQGAPGLVLYEPPVPWPYVAGVTYPLQPGVTVTFTPAHLPNLTVDICSKVPPNSLVRNDSEADAKNSAGTLVSMDAFAYVRCPPSQKAEIQLLKQISVDNGVTWLDADTSATAPTVTAPHGALYRFIVTNSGDVGLYDVSISDPTLGLTKVQIPGASLTAKQSVTITSLAHGFGSLSQPNRCTSSTTGNLTNIAKVTGTTTGGQAVTDSNPAVLICQSAPPPKCVAASSIASNFNGTSIAKGSYIWFNSNFEPSGSVVDGTNVSFTGSSIRFTSNSTSYNVPVPEALITFKASASCATTSFNTSLNRWETTVPLKNSDEIFLSGVVFPVPTDFQKGIKPVTWTGTFGTDTPGVAMKWKWGAAVYTCIGTDYNAINILPAHHDSCIGGGGNHAGTPQVEAIKACVVGGARGGGGSNWTGSWSGTASVEPVCR